MAEVIAVAISDFVGGDFVLTAAIQSALQIAAVVGTVQYGREQQRRARNRARDAYNASLRDRYVMVRTAATARAFVLGRQRVSGPVAYVGSYGANREHLALCVLLAAHEVDAVEAVYFDDERVTLDGSGNVLAVNRRDLFTLTGTGDTFTLTSEPDAATVSATVDYGSTQVALSVSVAGSSVTVSGGTAGQTGTVTVTYQPLQSPWVPSKVVQDTDTISLDGSGNGSVTLAHAPVAGSVHVVYTTGAGTDNQADTNLDAYTGVAGSVVTVTGASVTGASAGITYQYLDGPASKARVRIYTGAPGQAADAGLLAALPDVWDSGKTFTGQAYLVVELDFDPDAFPSGIPNVSALVRGARVYDPRTATTAWSENPALLVRYVATHPMLGRLSEDQVNDTAIVAAANVCDGSASYVVGTQTFTRVLYTAGLVCNTGQRAADIIDDLVRAMAGRWALSAGALTLRAGAYTTPLQTLTEDWLADTAGVQVQAGTPRAELVNSISGQFVDQTRDYVEVDYPRVESATYIAADGATLPQTQTFNAITFGPQCQHVAGVAMREARYGTHLTVTCKLHAYPVEIFDTLYVSLERFGFDGAVFEVLDRAWTLDGGIKLTMKATDPAVYALAAAFDTLPLPPTTRLPSPFEVPAVTTLAAASGTGDLLKQADGTVQTRIAVTWDTITDALVLADGGVEVRYGLASEAEDQWLSEFAERGQAQVYLTRNVRDGLIYLIKARAYNRLVKGAWCAPVLHQVSTAGSAQLTRNYRNTASSSFTVTKQSHTPDGYSWQDEVITLSFTAEADGTANAYFDGTGTYVNASGFPADGQWSLQIATAAFDGWKQLNSPLVAAGATAQFSLSTTRSFDVTAGSSYTVSVYAKKLNLSDTFTIDRHELRVDVFVR